MQRICGRCGALTELTPRTVNQYSLSGVSPVTLKSRTDLARPSSVFTYRRQGWALRPTVHTR